MQHSVVPFNISLLELTNQKLQGLKPVRSLDMFEGGTTNFATDGLYSTEIFGKVGDERRGLRFSYIDIKVPVFHPVIHRTLISLKQLYGGIMSGTEYALWNPDIKDFERSDQLHGQTGYHYFALYWKDIEFAQSGSTEREQNILLVKKYQEQAMTTKVIVIPAGMRDLEISEQGHYEKDEINNLYYAILSISNTVPSSVSHSNMELLDNTRHNIQMKFNEIYDTIESMIEGKKKLIMDKWAARRIMNGTRNVITAMNTSTPYLGAPGAIDFNTTVIGTYQYLKTFMPVARYHLRNGFVSGVFRQIGTPVMLVNKATKKSEPVTIKNQVFDRWTTDEGLEKVITSFEDVNIRHRPIEIDGHYLGLIYKGPDNTFKIIQSIDEVPGSRSKLDVTPLTFVELLYLSCYSKMRNYPVLVTRYPITGIGSIYPSIGHMKTTVRHEVRRELNENWEPMSEEYTAHEFPISGEEFVNSLVPHSSRLKAMGADFDGDTCSCNGLYSDEAVAEITDFLSKKKAYVGTDGNFSSSTDVSTVALVMHNLTS